MQSGYIIDQKTEGFVVRGRPHRLDIPGSPEWLVDLCYDGGRERRELVKIMLRPYYLEAMSKKVRGDPFGFFEYNQFIASIAAQLMAPWQPPLRERGHDDQPPPGRLRAWALKQTEKTINKRVHAEWQRLLTKVDPTVLAVQKKVHSATWNCWQPYLLQQKELYKDKYIVKDILAFRAAAIATVACHYIGPWRESALEKMSHWRDLFAPDGMGAYAALNKTLTNLPGGIPPRLLSQLREVVLPRPIFNRLELAATILAGARTKDNLHVFAHATADEIKEAMRRISADRHRQAEIHRAEMIRQYPDAGWEHAPLPDPLSTRRIYDITTAVHYLLDFPDVHNGRLLGLTEKAIRWHGIDGREREARKTIKRFGSERNVALPPIPLPNVEGIRFLGTVGDVVTEGEQMQHCIASYSENAVEGRCFLFHAEYQGATATIEVSHTGRVMQAHGPRNCNNKATLWGEDVLAQWGRGFPSGSDNPMRGEEVDIEADFMADLEAEGIKCG